MLVYKFEGDLVLISVVLGDLFYCYMYHPAAVWALSIK